MSLYYFKRNKKNLSWYEYVVLKRFKKSQAEKILMCYNYAKNKKPAQ